MYYLVYVSFLSEKRNLSAIQKGLLDLICKLSPSICFRLTLLGLRRGWSLSQLPEGERRGTLQTGCPSVAVLTAN